MAIRALEEAKEAEEMKIRRRIEEEQSSNMSLQSNQDVNQLVFVWEFLKVKFSLKLFFKWILKSLVADFASVASLQVHKVKNKLLQYYKSLQSKQDNNQFFFLLKKTSLLSFLNVLIFFTLQIRKLFWRLWVKLFDFVSYIFIKYLKSKVILENKSSAVLYVI